MTWAPALVRLPSVFCVIDAGRSLSHNVDFCTLIRAGEGTEIVKGL